MIQPQLWNRRYSWPEWRQMHSNLNERDAQMLFEHELRMYDLYENDLMNLKEQRVDSYVQSLGEYETTIQHSINYGGIYVPPPPPPPPTLPLGYSVWFNGSDTSTMTFSGGEVESWEGKHTNTSASMTFVPDTYLDSTGVTHDSNINAVRLDEARYSGSVDPDYARALSYGTGSMTLFVVATINNVDVKDSYPYTNDVINLFGRQGGVVGVNATLGQWNIEAKSTEGNSNAAFNPRLSVQITSNGQQHFTGNISADTGSVFLYELQISKSNDTAELKSIVQSDGNTGVIDNIYSSIDNIIASTDDTLSIPNSNLNKVILNDRNAYKSDTSYHQIIQYPQLLSKTETEQVYKVLNHYTKANFVYTASFLD